MVQDYNSLNRKLFGKNFIWGISTAAFQTEGSCDIDGKGPSIWDDFTARKGKIKGSHTANVACDFYNGYQRDISLLRKLHIPNFRFSLAWSRIMPDGKAALNHRGIDFYNRVIDHCLENDIQPWLTIYHWDLPLALERKGGWTNRDIVEWFADYVEVCARHFGDRVSNWIVMNEPMVFTGAGYFIGVHAPGKLGLRNFLPSIHHATLAMAAGGRVIFP